MEGVKNSVTAQDIDDAIDITNAQENSDLERNDTKILKGIVKFGNISVSQIMRSRVDMVGVDYDTQFPSQRTEKGPLHWWVIVTQGEKLVGTLPGQASLAMWDSGSTPPEAACLLARLAQPLRDCRHPVGPKLSLYSDRRPPW